MKHKLWGVALLIAIVSCKKDCEITQLKANSASQSDALIKWFTIKVGTDTFKIFKYTGIDLNYPTIKTERMAIDTFTILLTKMAGTHYAYPKAAVNRLTSYSASKVPRAGWLLVSFKSLSKGTGVSASIEPEQEDDEDPENPPSGGGYEFFITFYHDFSWPAPNYSITIYFNVDDLGHMTDAAIRTDTWGYGYYDEYYQITNPEPYVDIDWYHNSISWHAEGKTHTQTNIGFVANLTTDVPVSYTGNLTINKDGSLKYGYSNVQAHGNKSNIIGGNGGH